jgi:lipopolysaccharide/colanic/teichoic acid biosynthesis glycosyltransferase
MALAAITPGLALYLRGLDFSAPIGDRSAASYVLASFLSSLIAFLILRTGDPIPRYFSLSDVVDLAKAVLASEFLAVALLFAVTRLDGIPRSLPAIHLLLLGAGLFGYRSLASLASRKHRGAEPAAAGFVGNAIFVGLNDWSVVLIKFLQAHAQERWRVIALLDEEVRWIGRSVSGVRVFGPPAHLDALVEEFSAHGVRADRVVVGLCELSTEALAEVQRVCTRRRLGIVFAPPAFGLVPAERADLSAARFPDLPAGCPCPPELARTPYHRCKRFADAAAAMILILWLAPLLALAAVMVFVDLGWPVLFWQQRTGRGGRELQLYKLRTLRPPFDRSGRRIPEARRLSWIGRFLRHTRIDELPQLLNVLVGDMSLIGPRPLLPQDQPAGAGLRLTVRPGITGWAQVNGGAGLSPTEKQALDFWYIRNASLWVDLRIVGRTLITLLRGDRRSEGALAQAQQAQNEPPAPGRAADPELRVSEPVAWSRGTAAATRSTHDGGGGTSTTRFR